jgi:diguanylate cyclase (GGDEF)-like protein/PAS domain S-box-containing protein
MKHLYNCQVKIDDKQGESKMKKILIVVLSLIAFSSIIFRAHAIENIDYENLFDNHQSIMLIINPMTGDIYYANNAAVDFYGYPLETLLEMNIDQINTLTPEEVAEERLRALEEERNFFIFKHKLASGDIKTVYVYSYPVEIEGETYLYSIIIDQTAFVITQNRNRALIITTITLMGLAIAVTSFLAIKNKRAKNEISEMNKILYESEQRFKILHDASFGGLLIHDQGIILDCNQELSKITGYTMDELKGSNTLLLIHKNYHEIVNKHIKFGDEKPYEALGIRKNKEVYPLKLEARNIPYYGKQVRVVEFRDMTEIIKQQDVQKTLENQWSKLIQEMPLGFNLREMIFDDQGKPIDYKFLTINDRYETITGLKRKDIIGKYATEVLPNIENAWFESYAKVVKEQKTIAIEDFSRALDKYYRVVAYPYKDNQFVVVAEDITERKHNERELIKKEQEKSRVIANLPGVSYQCIFDEDWTMIYLSDGCKTLTGYDPSDLINNKNVSFNDIIVPKYRDYVFKEYEEAKKLNKSCNIEYELIKKDGSRIWIWEKGHVFMQDDIWYIEGFLMDITDRKISEQKINYASKHDVLTGLPNRTYFDTVIRRLDQPKNYPLSISIVDIDGLKLINDTYGHDVGDETILTFAKLLSTSCKDNSFIARIGSDEFGVVFAKSNQKHFEDLKDKVFDEISKIKIKDIPLSASCGTAIKTTESQQIEDILVEAENDMYAQKTLHNQSSRNQVIMALFDSLKDKYEAERDHSDRVSAYCLAMGEKLNLTTQEKLELEFAGRMHDIGKITIPDSILKKPGKLTSEEWVIMKNHTINGYQILKSADKYSNLADYALTHHERWDGKGYPKGLSKEDIPLFSRIIAIADAFEAMTADRPYRKAMDSIDAIKELYRCSGSQFDPNLVDVFVKDVLVDTHTDEN